jgi:SAM-dependent methyltransferase
MMNSGGPVLEIGCGTGRIFTEAINKGVDIYGIDISKLMQNYLKKKIQRKDYFRLKLADVRKFNFGKGFNLIIVPFRMFSHLISVEDQLQALGNIHNHLRHGGRFIFDVFLPDLDLIKKGIENSIVFEGEHEPGKRLQRLQSSIPDYINQTQHVKFKDIWEETDGVHEDSFEFPMRYFFRYELEHLIARANLKLVKMNGDFHKNEINSSSKDMVCVCTK